MTLLKTVNKKYICNVAFIIVISKVIQSKVFMSIVVVSKWKASEPGNIQKRKILSLFTNSFCKLDRFRAMERIVYLQKRAILQKD
jgi:hypothetical protein